MPPAVAQCHAIKLIARRPDAAQTLQQRRENFVGVAYPDPVSPMEREMFAAVIAEECGKPATPGHRVERGFGLL